MNVKTFGARLDEAAAERRRLASAPRLDYGLELLDSGYGPTDRGDFLIIAGSSGLGKTEAALCVARTWARSVPMVYAALEGYPGELEERTLFPQFAAAAQREGLPTEWLRFKSWRLGSWQETLSPSQLARAEALERELAARLAAENAGLATWYASEAGRELGIRALAAWGQREAERPPEERRGLVVDHSLLVDGDGDLADVTRASKLASVLRKISDAGSPVVLLTQYKHSWPPGELPTLRAIFGGGPLYQAAKTVVLLSRVPPALAPELAKGSMVPTLQQVAKSRTEGSMEPAWALAYWNRRLCSYAPGIEIGHIIQSKKDGVQWIPEEAA